MPGVRQRNASPHPDFQVPLKVTQFWKLVAQGSEDSCWEWLGDLDKDGYGVYFWQGKRIGAHQLALSFFSGEKKSPGFDTCHSCDNPKCCNPKHLRFDTRKSNVADMIRRGRSNPALKITDAEVKEIRIRRANGARQIDLAKDYGISDGLVSEIVRGLKRKNAGGPIETTKQIIRKAA